MFPFTVSSTCHLLQGHGLFRKVLSPISAECTLDGTHINCCIMIFDEELSCAEFARGNDESWSVGRPWTCSHPLLSPATSSTRRHLYVSPRATTGVLSLHQTQGPEGTINKAPCLANVHHVQLLSSLVTSSQSLTTETRPTDPASGTANNKSLNNGYLFSAGEVGIGRSAVFPRQSKSQ